MSSRNEVQGVRVSPPRMENLLNKILDVCLTYSTYRFTATTRERHIDATMIHHIFRPLHQPLTFKVDSSFCSCCRTNLRRTACPNSTARSSALSRHASTWKRKAASSAGRLNRFSRRGAAQRTPV